MIAYFVYNLDSYSGAAQQALKLAENIDQKIVFFNFNYSSIKQRKYNDKIFIIDLGKNKLMNIFTIIYFTFKYNIFIYHLHGFFLYALILGGLLNKKIILKTTMYRDDDFKTISHKKLGRLKVWLIQKVVDINVVLTKKILEMNAKFLSRKKIIHIPNGVDIDTSVEIVKEKNSFCFVGLVCDRKNTLESIKYFNNFYKELEDAKLYIVGPYKDIANIADFSEVYVKECFDYIKNHNLEKQVVFTDLLSKEETYEIYKKSKALLFFSKKEGMPNVVLEAMAYNCVPVMSGMDGVAQEILEHSQEKTGFILSSFDKKIDIQSIDKIVDEKYPQKIINKFYSIKSIIDKYEKVYKV